MTNPHLSQAVGWLLANGDAGGSTLALGSFRTEYNLLFQTIVFATTHLVVVRVRPTIPVKCGLIGLRSGVMSVLCFGTVYNLGAANQNKFWPMRTTYLPNDQIPLFFLMEFDEFRNLREREKIGNFFDHFCRDFND